MRLLLFLALLLSLDACQSPSRFQAPPSLSSLFTGQAAPIKGALTGGSAPFSNIRAVTFKLCSNPSRISIAHRPAHKPLVRFAG